MLKHLTILAVIVAAVWSPKPIPRQATNGGSQSSQNPKQQTDSGKSPAEPHPVITIIGKNCDSEAFKNDRDCKAAEDKPSPVVIRELSPANVTIDRNTKRDVFDWIAYGGDLLLVIVGIGTLIAVWKQAKRMKEHAEELKKLAVAAKANAEAALEQANHIVAAERPWVAVEHNAPKLIGNRIILTAINRGKSPAKITMSMAECVFPLSLDFPEGPAFTTDGLFDMPLWLLPERETEIGDLPFAGGAVIDKEGRPNERIRAGQQFALVWGFVRYLDTMTEDVHETRFCYRIVFMQGGNLLTMFRARGFNTMT